jgi:Flp pilus assembly pilin Flp
MPPTTRSAASVRLRRRFIAEERGATTVEYALVSSLLAVLAIGSLVALADETEGLLAFTAEALHVAADRLG